MVCTAHISYQNEEQAGVSALGLISSRGSLGSRSPRGQRLAVLPGPARALLGGCGVLGAGGHLSLCGEEGP